MTLWCRWTTVVVFLEHWTRECENFLCHARQGFVVLHMFKVEDMSKQGTLLTVIKRFVFFINELKKGLTDKTLSLNYWDCFQLLVSRNEGIKNVFKEAILTGSQHDLLNRTKSPNENISKLMFEVRHVRLPNFETALRNFLLLVFLADNRTGHLRKINWIRDIVSVESFHRIRWYL